MPIIYRYLVYAHHIQQGLQNVTNGLAMIGNAMQYNGKRIIIVLAIVHGIE
jgi:hypothetical protein